MSKEYRAVAKKLGVRYLFARWGVSFKAGLPSGRNHFRIKFVALNGWVFDPKEIENAIRQDDAFTVTTNDRCYRCGNTIPSPDMQEAISRESDWRSWIEDHPDEAMSEGGRVLICIACADELEKME